MRYHKATIQLIAKGNAVQIKGFRGLPVDLEQVKKAIHGIEQFLGSSNITRTEGACWEKGMLIMPGNAQLKTASLREQELWARHIDSEGKAPPPGFEVCDGFQQERKMLAQARSIYGQMFRHMSIARFMMERQQPFLQSGNWMEKAKLTILEIADYLPEWGEKTVRDSIHSLSFALKGNTFPADILVCASEMPSLCKQIAAAKKTLPNAGAPMLESLLHEQGIQVSRRMIGSALHLITSQKSRQLAQESNPHY